MIYTKTVLVQKDTYESKTIFKLNQTIYQVDVGMGIYLQTKDLNNEMTKILTVMMDDQTHVRKNHFMIALNSMTMEVASENMCDQTMFMNQNTRKSEMMVTTQHLMAEMINEKLKLDGTVQHQ